MTLAASALAQAADTRPNILFIAIDDMKPNLSCYGDTVAHTPNFDRLAAMGTTFTGAYCQQALSGPTRASLMTGLRPDHTGVWALQNNFRKVNPAIVSLPENLMKQGYETVGVGKIYHPLDNKKWRNDPPSWSEPYINTSAPKYLLANGQVATECADVPDNAYEDGIIAEEGIAAMKRLAAAGKPFFLGVGFKRPHLPFNCPKKYWDMYNRESMPLAEFQQMSSDPVPVAYHPSNELKAYTDIPAFHSFDDCGVLDEATQKRLIHGNYACISYVDAQLGKLLDAVEELGLADNTIIFLYGDHGYHLGDHGLWNKLTNFEQATHCCMMLAAPGMKKGVKSASVAEFVDVYPTLCELTGTTTPENLDGKSLVPVLKNPKAKTKKYAFSQFPRNATTHGYTVRGERYRYTEWHKNWKSYEPYDGREPIGIELYDYEKDPLETTNLAHDPKYAKVLKQMQDVLHEQYARTAASPMAAPVAQHVAAKEK